MLENRVGRMQESSLRGDKGDDVRIGNFILGGVDVLCDDIVEEWWERVPVAECQQSGDIARAMIGGSVP